ncbi:GAF domain-containing sensor histidine kinase [Candidatus Leptofilum sp.]|uniref:sensor histidine kinase n=1 Tax=Candidatus Leptofilum sp. TaxID=3241576 RepID=UPI003B5A664A
MVSLLPFSTRKSQIIRVIVIGSTLLLLGLILLRGHYVYQSLLTEESQKWRLYLKTFSFLIAPIALAGFSFFVWLRRPFDLTVLYFVAWQQLMVYGLVVPLQFEPHPDFNTYIVGTILAYLAATLIVFHLHLTEIYKQQAEKLRRVKLWLYGLATLLVVIWWAQFIIQAERSFVLQQLLTSFFLLACLIGIAISVQAWRKGSVTIRRRLRLALVGSSLSMALLIFAYLLPFIFGGIAYLGDELLVLILLLIPISYGAAIFRDGFWAMERILNRTIVHLLLLGVLAFLFLGVAFVLPRVLPLSWVEAPFTWGLVTLVTAVLFTPLRHFLQQLVDRLLYGGWYDYQSVIKAVGHQLNNKVEIDELAELLVDRLQEILHLDGAAFYLREGQQLQPVRARGVLSAATALMMNATAVKTLQLKKRATFARDLPSLPENGADLWVPLVQNDRLTGLLLLGKRFGEETLPENDCDLLQTIAWQAAVSLENIHLVQNLSNRAAEIDQLYHQVVSSREDERKRLARELHDQVIQDLIYLHQVTGIVSKNSQESEAETIAFVRQQLQQIVDALRTICTELRPTALDDLSLRLAVQGFVETLNRNSHPQTQLTIAGDDMALAEPLADEVALTVFRAIQEAVRNALAHAQASKITVDLAIESTQINVVVADDGIGFRLPSNGSGMVKEGHFGLAGMQERVQGIGGEMALQTAVNGGTTITITAPVIPQTEPYSSRATN